MKQKWTIFLSLIFTARCMLTAISATFYSLSFAGRPRDNVDAHSTWPGPSHSTGDGNILERNAHWGNKEILSWWIAANTFISKLSSLESEAVTPYPSLSGLLTSSGHDLWSALLWEPRPTLFQIQPPSILEESHFTKSAIHHPQTPGSLSPCQEQGQILWVIGCRLCNLTAAEQLETRGEVTGTFPGRGCDPDTSDSISEAIRCVSNSRPIFKQRTHSKTSQHILF